MTINEEQANNNTRPRRSTRNQTSTNFIDSDGSFNSNMSSSEPETNHNNNIMPDTTHNTNSQTTDTVIENVPPEIPAGIKKFKFIQPPPAPIFYPTEEEWYGQSPFDYINSMRTCFIKKNN